MSESPTLANLVLSDPAGASVRLGDILTRPTVLLRVRYFG